MNIKLFLFMISLSNFSIIISKPNKMLLRGVNENNIKLIREALDNGANVNERYENNDTILHIAVLKKNPNTDIDILKLLISSENINARNNYGYTPLYVAFLNFNPDINIIRLLIDSGADVNIKANDGTTALILAVAYNKPDIVDLLINSNADVNAQDNLGNTPLYTEINKMNPNISIIEKLLNAGADTNIKNKLNNETALELAKSKKRKDIVELIENRQKKVSRKIKEGTTLISDISDIVADYIFGQTEKDKDQKKESE